MDLLEGGSVNVLGEIKNCGRWSETVAVITTKYDFIVSSQVNEISLTVNEFYELLMFLLTVNNYY